MSIRKMALVAALGVSMASVPVMAQTSAPAIERAGATMEDANDQGVGRNSTTTFIVAFFVILAIGLGLYAAFGNEGDPPAISA